MKARPHPRFVLKAAIGFCLLCFLVVATDALALDLSMKGPKMRSTLRPARQEPETSCVKLAFGSAIRFFQRRISAADGPDRCGFRPSCSTYGYQAIAEQGPWIGLMMIGDRLTRCNIWKGPGADYTLLPNGKLYDPPSHNVLHRDH